MTKQAPERITKPYTQHLYERLQTPEDRIGYIRACIEEGLSGPPVDLLPTAVEDIYNAGLHAADLVRPVSAVPDGDTRQLLRDFVALTADCPDPSRLIAACTGIAFAERQRIWRLAYSTACAGNASDYCLRLIQQIAEGEGVSIQNLRPAVPTEGKGEGEQEG